MKYCSRAEGMLTCGIKFVSYMENYLNPKDNMSTFSLKMTFSGLFFFFCIFIQDFALRLSFE